MMTREKTVVAAVVLGVTANMAWAQMASWVSSDVLMRNFTTDGTNRTSSQIMTALNKISNRQCRVIFDGGPWTVDSSIGFPTNVSVSVARDCYFNVSTNCIVTFSNNVFDAGPYLVFSGNGSATGSASFLYRWAEWGDQGRFNIGTGVLGQAISTTQSFTMVSGTIGTFQQVLSGTSTIFKAIITTGVVANAVIGTGTLTKATVSDFTTTTVDINGGTGDFQKVYVNDGNFWNLTVSNTAALRGDTWLGTAGALSYSSYTQYMARPYGSNVWVSSSADGSGALLLGPEFTRTVTGVVNATTMYNVTTVALGKWIPAGVTLTVKYPAGTYGLTANQDFSGFFGGGEIEIEGDTSSTLFTNQTVIFTNALTDVNTGMFRIRNNDVHMRIRGFRFDIKGTNSGAIFIENCPRGVKVESCYFECDTTNELRSPIALAGDRHNYGVRINRSNVDVSKCYAKSNTMGLWIDYNSVVTGYSNFNTSASDKCLYGVYVDRSSRYGCWETNHFRGAKYDGQAVNGGEIVTNGQTQTISNW